MSKYLVTGGAGFIGSHVARRLLAAGHHVWVMDNLLTGHLANVPGEAQFLQLDLSDPASIDHLPAIRFDAVLHLAAQSSGEISHEKPAYDLLTNALGTLRLLQWCASMGIDRFLHASSMGVYGNAEQLPVHESAPCQPLSFYGITKLAAEHYVRHFVSSGMKATVFRMFNVYGPGQNLTNVKQGMVSIYLAYLLAKEPLVVKGSFDRVRDLVYIDDVVDAWMLALENRVTGLFNLGSGHGTTVRTLVASLIDACDLGDDYPVQQAGNTAGDQHTMWADITAVRGGLNWEPRVPLAEGLKRMVGWARAGQGASL